MADISKFDDISKLQTYEDYIANNITEWEAESIARVCRKIGKVGKMSKKELGIWKGAMENESVSR